jgi:chromosome segregation ATPase
MSKCFILSRSGDLKDLKWVLYVKMPKNYGSSVDKLQTDIEAISSQIEALQRERQQISIAVTAPVGDSPQEIADAYRRHARETAQVSAEVKGIDDAIAALSAQLGQKQRQSGNLQKLSPMEEQVEEGRELARGHAKRINELATELASEVKGLKAIADQISPSYWQVYYKPFITGFKSISVPYVRSDGDVWTIVNRVV